MTLTTMTMVEPRLIQVEEFTFGIDLLVLILDCEDEVDFGRRTTILFLRRVSTLVDCSLVQLSLSPPVDTEPASPAVVVVVTPE